MAKKDTVKVNRMNFETKNVPLGEEHAVFKIKGLKGEYMNLEETQTIKDTKHGWELTKMECCHCDFGFWTIRVGDYGHPSKKPYLIEEFNLKKGV